MLGGGAQPIADWPFPMKDELFELREKKVQEMTEELLFPMGEFAATALAAILILILLWQNLRLA